MMLLSLVVTGWLRHSEPAISIHLWFGHVLVIVAYLGFPFAAGVMLQRQIRQRPILAIVRLLALIFFFGLTLLASMTGYLGPSHASPSVSQLSEESQTRFAFIHMLALPLLLAIMTTELWWFLRKSRVISAEHGSSMSEQRTDHKKIETGNPYQSPPS